MAQWYIFENEVTVGPFEDGEMVRLASGGRLGAETPVRRGVDGAWTTWGVASSSGVAGEAELPSAEIISEQDGELKFACPGCRQRYRGAAAEYRGAELECGSCGIRFRVPAGVSPAAVPEEAPDLSEEIPEGEITCPHCWKSFPREFLMYISSHPALAGDPVAGEFEQRRFRPAVFNTVGQPLDAYGLPCTDMACPHCHLRIPAAIIDLPSHYFSIVGAPSSGKSYYLTALVHQLRRVLPESFGCSFFDVDPQLNAVIDSYESSIFMAVDPGRVATLPKTQQTGSDFSNQVLLNQVPTELPKPFVFELKSLTYGKAGTDANVIFYDNAGEHFQPGADVLVNPATQHLACSDGIIFLFDPLNDAVMRRICDPADPQLGSSFKVTDQTVLLAEMINRIRRHRNLSAAESCRIPLVIAVAKYDAWCDRFARRPREIETIVEDGDAPRARLALGRVLDISFSLREFLLEFVPGLVNTAESFFEQVYFVPVSNFGHPASRDEVSGGIGIIPGMLDPVWVEVPFLLLLAELGLLDTAWEAPPPPDPTFSVRLLDGVIVFKHPVTGRRLRVPRNYLGAVLELGAKRYAMPPRPPRGRSVSAARDLWQ